MNHQVIRVFQKWNKCLEVHSIDSISIILKKSGGFEQVYNKNSLEILD